MGLPHAFCRDTHTSLPSFCCHHSRGMTFKAAIRGTRRQQHITWRKTSRCRAATAAAATRPYVALKGCSMRLPATNATTTQFSHGLGPCSRPTGTLPNRRSACGREWRTARRQHCIDGVDVDPACALDLQAGKHGRRRGVVLQVLTGGCGCVWQDDDALILAATTRIRCLSYLLGS